VCAGPAATGAFWSRRASLGASTARPVAASSVRGVPHAVAQTAASARKTVFLAVSVVLCLIGCSAPPEAESKFEFSRLAMGVETRIVLHAPSVELAAAAADAAYAAIDRLEQSFSDWRPDSELSQLAERAGSGPVPVADDLLDILRRARAISAATDGAFDVTVGPLVALWRETRRTRALPDAIELERARALVGWRLVELDEARRTVALAKPGMRLDLGGIGKGYACQRALEVLASRGLERALIQMGGDIVCGAAPPGREGWDIDVGGATRSVHDVAVATSGDSEQHVEIDGVRYSHVVDPRTGLGVIAARQITIEAADGATADALATAGSLLSPHLLERALRCTDARRLSR